MPDSAAPTPTDDKHIHDLRRNPFVNYPLGSTLHEEIACAVTDCHYRFLRPMLASPLAVGTWPKA